MGGEVLHRVIEKQIIIFIRFLQDELGARFIGRMREVVGRERFKLRNFRHIGRVEILLEIVHGIKHRRLIIMGRIQISENDAERLRGLPEKLHPRIHLSKSRVAPVGFFGDHPQLDAETIIPEHRRRGTKGVGQDGVIGKPDLPGRFGVKKIGHIVNVEIQAMTIGGGLRPGMRRGSHRIFLHVELADDGLNGVSGARNRGSQKARQKTGQSNNPASPLEKMTLHNDDNGSFLMARPPRV